MSLGSLIGTEGAVGSPVMRTAMGVGVGSLVHPGWAVVAGHPDRRNLEGAAVRVMCPVKAEAAACLDLPMKVGEAVGAVSSLYSGYPAKAEVEAILCPGCLRTEVGEVIPAGQTPAKEVEAVCSSCLPWSHCQGLGVGEAVAIP